MADLNIIYSFTLLDDSGKKRPVQIYATEHDADTVAAAITNLTNLAALLDALTDGQIVQQRLVVYKEVSGALKSAPVSGANLEETGLLNYPMTGLLNRGYSIDIPAFPDGKTLALDHNLIDLTDTAVAAFNTFISTVGFPQVKDDDWQAALGAVRSGVVTFRKLRRQTHRRRF